jgi:glutamate/tyrosine decarboxylase-like PLP-dependent enzyme
MSENDIMKLLQPVAEPKHEGDSLDPADWDKFLGHCIAELRQVTRHLSSVRNRPAWQPVPGDVKQAIQEDLPLEPQGAEGVCKDIRSNILPYLLGNTHPRFFGWVHGSGTAGGLIADLYAAAMNANLGGREHAPVYVERTVIDWCKRIFAFPETSSGLLVSGTSMANAVAVAVARNHHCPVDVREEGLTLLSKTMVGYTSTESHCSVAKAFELLGLGRKQLRKIPVNRNFQIDLEALQTQVARDREAGFQPFCVVGTAGTVNCAAIDDDYL